MEGPEDLTSPGGCWRRRRARRRGERSCRTGGGGGARQRRAAAAGPALLPPAPPAPSAHPQRTLVQQALGRVRGVGQQVCEVAGGARQLRRQLVGGREQRLRRVGGPALALGAAVRLLGPAAARQRAAHARAEPGRRAASAWAAPRAAGGSGRPCCAPHGARRGAGRLWRWGGCGGGGERGRHAAGAGSALDDAGVHAQTAGDGGGRHA